MTIEDLKDMKRSKPDKTTVIGTGYYNSYANGFDDGYNEAIDDIIEAMKEQGET